MIERGTYVRFTKLNAVQNPDVPTLSLDQYKYGDHNPGVSVPKGYEVTGLLINDIEEGMSILIARDSRNGIKVGGVLQTSIIAAVHEIDEDNVRITTANSVYVMKREEKEEEKDVLN